ncbi:hypothetical protein KC319_g58 [Hortaea werneckii]|nr:hypothetical protein KC319_g58 [Hortaea werneckii]
MQGFLRDLGYKTAPSSLVFWDYRSKNGPHDLIVAHNQQVRPQYVTWRLLAPKGLAGSTRFFRTRACRARADTKANLENLIIATCLAGHWSQCKLANASVLNYRPNRDKSVQKLLDAIVVFKSHNYDSLSTICAEYLHESIFTYTSSIPLISRLPNDLKSAVPRTLFRGSDISRVQSREESVGRSLQNLVVVMGAVGSRSRSEMIFVRLPPHLETRQHKLQVEADLFFLASSFSTRISFSSSLLNFLHSDLGIKFC